MTAASSSRVFTIMDNFRDHERQLRARGATDREIAKLLSAARDVEAAEKRAKLSTVDVASASLPLDLPLLGWRIAPPTKEAVSWARTAVEAITGGREPAPGIGQLMALLAGLWALREVGDGRASDVMRATATDGLAGCVQGLVEQVRSTGVEMATALNQLAEVYARAMGFRLPPTLSGAIEKYGAALEQICGRIVLGALPRRSRKASRRPISSACRGKRSGAASRPRSSTRDSSRR